VIAEVVPAAVRRSILKLGPATLPRGRVYLGFVSPLRHDVPSSRVEGLERANSVGSFRDAPVPN
jgi:hypothetical protein